MRDKVPAQAAIDEPPVASTSDNSDAIAPHHLCRVLIIDDDEFVCRTVSGQLRTLGVADLTVMSDGPRAVHLLNEGPLYNLIICDLSMPKVDGIQMLRLIAARQKQAAVLFISSAGEKLLSSAEDLARSRGLRILGAWPKPVKSEQLRRALAELSGEPRQSAREHAAPTVSPADLRRALRNEEIKVYVQPQLDAKTGLLHGVEALARWNSPEHGFVSPACFVPLAESCGLIDELTEGMLAKSLAACGSWNRAGLKTRISVNVPISAVCSLSLPDTVVDAAERRGLEAGQLTLEITESGFMQDPVRSLDVMTRLRLRGVGLAIDDFGCGYSSLQQLKRMPFDELKIDCSFVISMLRDREAASIVKSSLELSRELGLRSVAEGVESSAHWDALLGLGCDVVQGYHIARPFPVEQFPHWYARQAPAFRRKRGLGLSSHGFGLKP